MLPSRGYRRLYALHVTQADHGCDFDFLREEAGTASTTADDIQNALEIT
jgi:hypothetical protein